MINDSFVAQPGSVPGVGGDTVIVNDIIAHQNSKF